MSESECDVSCLVVCAEVTGETLWCQVKRDRCDVMVLSTVFTYLSSATAATLD